MILQVTSCLRPCGYLALSVPHRERWLNRLEDAGALRNLWSPDGFEIPSVRNNLRVSFTPRRSMDMALRMGF